MGMACTPPKGQPPRHRGFPSPKGIGDAGVAALGQHSQAHLLPGQLRKREQEGLTE